MAYFAYGLTDHILGVVVQFALLVPDGVEPLAGLLPIDLKELTLIHVG